MNTYLEHEHTTLLNNMSTPSKDEGEGQECRLRPCVVLLNGYPGVGKATIAKALQSALPSNVPSRLLERHALLDLSEAINPGCLETRDDIMVEAFIRLGSLPDEETIIIATDSLAQDDWEDTRRYYKHSLIAFVRNVPFFVVNLHCDAKINVQRLCNEERKAMRVYGKMKLVDADALLSIRTAFACIDLKKAVEFPHEVEFHHLDLDISEASVEDSMEGILDFLKNPF